MIGEWNLLPNVDSWLFLADIYWGLLCWWSDGMFVTMVSSIRSLMERSKAKIESNRIIESEIVDIDEITFSLLTHICKKNVC